MPITNDKSDTNLNDGRVINAIDTEYGVPITQLRSSSSHKDTAISFAPQQPITQLRSRGGPSGSSDTCVPSAVLKRGYLVKARDGLSIRNSHSPQSTVSCFNQNTPTAYM